MTKLRTEPLFISERRFEVWLYVVSHGQLLLRSVVEERSNTRIEILFKNVQFMHLDSLFNGVEIAEVDPATFQYPISSRMHKGYSLKSDGSTGYVVAGGIFVSEDQDVLGPSAFRDSIFLPGKGFFMS